MIFVFICALIFIWHIKTSSFIENDIDLHAASEKKIDRCRALLAQVDTGEVEIEKKLPKLSYKENIRFSVPEEENPQYTSIWGLENLTQDKKTLHTFFPQGSYKPSIAPRGGAGFIYNNPELQGKKHVILSYTLGFADNFDFVKGGKLPGLCSGDCPRGGAGTDDGFSTRFMWRKDGDLEVYGYLPDTSTSMGQSIGRGMFRFETGKYYELSQEIILNTLGKKDGILRVYVDDIMVYERNDMMYQKETPLSLDTIIFSTFFGGGDTSWATPVDTSITFKDFQIQWN